MRGRAWSFYAALFLFLFLQTAFAAELKLPGSFASWRSDRAMRFSSAGLEQTAPGDGQILEEYGAIAAERREFARRGEHLTITLYRFRDPSGAYGMLTFWRSPEMDPLKIGAPAVTEAAANNRRLLAAVGNCLVDVQGAGVRGLTEIDLRGMILGLAKSAGEAPILSSLPSYLPRPGLVENSERYVLGTEALERLYPLKQGDWVGFAYGAEAELARYQLGERTQTLLLVLYPTPQIAMERSKDLARYFTLNEEKPRGNLPSVFLKRAGPLVAIVLDAGTESYAGFLLDRVDYRWNVTWSERSSRKDEAGWFQMIKTIFMGTGLMLIITVVASLAFAGFRLLMSRYFPGKIFDRASSSEIIQLHLDRK